MLFLICAVKARGQYQEPSPEKLCAAFETLSFLSDSTRQLVFFNAFPNTGEQFSLLYEENPHLTGTPFDLHTEGFLHIHAFWNLTRVPDSTFIEKAVRISCGLRYGLGASWYWRWHLREALRQPVRANGILIEVARLRRGHQMQFWSLVWSTSKSDDRDLLFEWLRTYMQKHVPQTVEVSDLAFRFFHGRTHPRPLPAPIESIQGSTCGQVRTGRLRTNNNP